MNSKILLIIAVLLFTGCNNNDESNSINENPTVVSTVDTTADNDSDNLELQDVITYFGNNVNSFSYEATEKRVNPNNIVGYGQNIGVIYYYTYDAKNGILKKESEDILQEDDPYAEYEASINEPSVYYDLNAKTMHSAYGNLDITKDFEVISYEYPSGPFERIVLLLNKYTNEIEYNVENNEDTITYTITNLDHLYNLSYSQIEISEEEIEEWFKSSGQVENDSLSSEQNATTETLPPQNIENRFSSGKMVLTFDKNNNLKSIYENYNDSFVGPDNTGVNEISVEIVFAEQEELTIPTRWTGSKEE